MNVLCSRQSNICPQYWHSWSHHNTDISGHHLYNFCSQISPSFSTCTILYNVLFHSALFSAEKCLFILQWNVCFPHRNVSSFTWRNVCFPQRNVRSVILQLEGSLWRHFSTKEETVFKSCWYLCSHELNIPRYHSEKGTALTD